METFGEVLFILALIALLLLAAVAIADWVIQ